MVKMAEPLPKFAPVATSSMYLNNMTKAFTLSNSDAVKRLLSRPNILVQKVPLTTNRDEILKKDASERSANVNSSNLVKPELTIIPVSSPNDDEDANLLPSKMRDKKSGITLLPVKRKFCGHYESCESIVCEVIVQQYVHDGRISPVLAVNIEESEINAPVTKHCKDEYCDALNIDHDRCRSAIIRLYRCDTARRCDVCDMLLMSRKSRIHHTRCARKNEYRHNDVDNEHLLRDKLRERELQILEDGKTRSRNYSDPVRGYDLAMETLQKNKELIIIPTESGRESTAAITSLPSAQSIADGPFYASRRPAVVNSHSDVGRESVASYVVAPPRAAILSGDALFHSQKNGAQPMAQLRFAIAQQHQSVSASIPPVLPQCSYVQLATPSPTVTQPVTVNNWIVSSPQVLTTAPIQSHNNSSNVLMPIRVVPIANLKTAPSLLHRTQGIPKFCIVADNSVITPVTIPNPPPLQPTTMVGNGNSNANGNAERASKIPIQRSKLTSQARKKLTKRYSKKPKKKFYFCVYCSKHFSTDWYYKRHVAKHKGEKLYTCNLCDRSFGNWYDMKKHHANEHKEGERCDRVRSSNSRANEDSIEKTLDKTDDKSKISKEDEEREEAVERKGQRTVNETNHKSSTVDLKKLKCKNKRERGANGNEEISVSTVKKQSRDDLKSPIESTCVEESDNKELSIDGDRAITSVFTSVSEKNIDPKNLINEVIVSR